VAAGVSVSNTWVYFCGEEGQVYSDDVDVNVDCLVGLYGGGFGWLGLE